eukprot:SAG31_NODE_21659_length_544_cov_0.811236_1_plen_94_part_01
MLLIKIVHLDGAAIGDVIAKVSGLDKTMFAISSFSATEVELVFPGAVVLGALKVAVRGICLEGGLHDEQAFYRSLANDQKDGSNLCPFQSHPKH